MDKGLDIDIDIDIETGMRMYLYRRLWYIFLKLSGWRPKAELLI